MSWRKRAKEIIIVDHCNWDCKRTEKIFNLKPINPCFYSQPSIGLGQKSCWHSNIPHTSVCCSSGESGHIKNGPAPDCQDNRVAINVKVVKLFVYLEEPAWIILYLLPPRNTKRRSNKSHGIPMRFEIIS
jgi:hypothetical protein